MVPLIQYHEIHTCTPRTSGDTCAWTPRAPGDTCVYMPHTPGAQQRQFRASQHAQGGGASRSHWAQWGPPGPAWVPGLTEEAELRTMRFLLPWLLPLLPGGAGCPSATAMSSRVELCQAPAHQVSGVLPHRAPSPRQWQQQQGSHRWVVLCPLQLAEAHLSELGFRSTRPDLESLLHFQDHP